MNELKVFTREEANQLIPTLTTLIQELNEKRERIADIEVEIDSLELVSDPEGERVPEGLESLIQKHRKEVACFYEIVDQIHSHGCLLKDVDTGLIDFFALIEGRVVYLGWRFGEEQVHFWHEVGQGYANRQPIS